MRTRRGTSSYWPSTISNHINTFEVGDLVVSVIVGSGNFYGVVRDVQHKLNKVMVAWGGGSVVQHDPEEIQLSLRQDDTVKSRSASTRRGRIGTEAEQAEADPQYVGDPKVNGLVHPRGGGFSIMQNLAKAQAKESLEQSSENPKVSPIQASKIIVAKKSNLRTKVIDNHGNEYSAFIEDKDCSAILRLKGSYGGSSWYVSTLLGRDGFGKGIGDKIYLDYGQDWYVTGMKKLMAEVVKSVKETYIVASEGLKSRRAMYWCGPDRMYRMTKQEASTGQPRCPKCCDDMGKHNFTRHSKLFICEGCGFKISSDKVLTEKPVVEAVPTEPQVTVASNRSRRQAI
jgi:hypothetical protein